MLTNDPGYSAGASLGTLLAGGRGRGRGGGGGSDAFSQGNAAAAGDSFTHNLPNT